MASMSSALEPDELDALLRGFEPLPDDLLPPDAIPAPSALDRDPPRLRPPSTARAIGVSAPDSPSSNDKPADGGRRARYRARSRNELLYLREVAAELERELARLTRRASAPGGRLSRPKATQVAVWKALAARQRLERRAAEAENARLRVLLENQLRFAAQLQTVAGPRALPRAGVDAADVRVFEAYLGELDAAYARTDAVLRETEMADGPETPRRVIRAQRPGADGQPSFAEFLDTYVLLAGLETARGNTWEVVMREYLKRGGERYDPETPQPGALALKFRYPHKWLGRDGAVSVTHTLKVYDEPGRQVAVYRVLSVGEGALTGIATDETGWSVLQPARADADRSVCRVVTRLEPMRFHRLPPQRSGEAPPQLVEFAKVLFQAGDEDFRTMLDHLQRLSLGADSSA
jgi:hypothetical protein